MKTQEEIRAITYAGQTFTPRNGSKPGMIYAGHVVHFDNEQDGDAAAQFGYVVKKALPPWNKVQGSYFEATGKQ